MLKYIQHPHRRHAHASLKSLLTRLSELSLSVTSRRKPPLTLTPISLFRAVFCKDLCFSFIVWLSIMRAVQLDPALHEGRNHTRPVQVQVLVAALLSHITPSAGRVCKTAFTTMSLASPVSRQWLNSWEADLQMAQRKPLNPTWLWLGWGWKTHSCKLRPFPMESRDDLAHFQVQWD